MAKVACPVHNESILFEPTKVEPPGKGPERGFLKTAAAIPPRTAWCEQCGRLYSITECVEAE
jgi:hypothetical protein